MLGVAGIGVEGQLRPTSLGVPGTESGAGGGVAAGALRGLGPVCDPAAGAAGALDRQGPALMRGAARRAGVSDDVSLGRGRRSRVAAGAAQGPDPGRLPRLRRERGEGHGADLDRTLEEQIAPPVRATQTGFATLSRAIQDESVALDRASPS